MIHAAACHAAHDHAMRRINVRNTHTTLIAAQAPPQTNFHHPAGTIMASSESKLHEMRLMMPLGKSAPPRIKFDLPLAAAGTPLHRRGAYGAALTL